MADRLVLGPQNQYERNGDKTFRDIRPLTTRLSEALRGSVSGLVIGMAAAATWFEPAIIDMTVPAALFYATWVLTRAPVLPLRLPRSADRPDYGNLAPGTRKPKARQRHHLHWLGYRRQRAMADRRRCPPAHHPPRHHGRR